MASRQARRAARSPRTHDAGGAVFLPVEQLFVALTATPRSSSTGLGGRLASARGADGASASSKAPFLRIAASHLLYEAFCTESYELRGVTIEAVLASGSPWTRRCRLSARRKLQRAALRCRDQRQGGGGCCAEDLAGAPNRRRFAVCRSRSRSSRAWSNGGDQGRGGAHLRRIDIVVGTYALLGKQIAFKDWLRSIASTRSG